MELSGNGVMQLLLDDDCTTVAAMLQQDAGLCRQLNEAQLCWGMPPLAAARSRKMADLLLAHGATIERVSRWWGPGFGANQVAPDTARYLVQCGAELTIHAATAMSLQEEVRELLRDDPKLALAPGGDGAHPLHFCSDVEIARLLIDHGADIEARDEDHDSTPVQWRIADAPDLVRWLLTEGATPDVFLAAALGDLELTRAIVSRQPDCTTFRIGNNRGPFPGIGFRGRGGSIYQWTLGFNLSPHEVALKHGHRDVYDFLMEHSPEKIRLLVACTLADRATAEQIAREHPQILETLDEEDQSLLAKFCWETNKDIEAVRLMLDVGFPIDARENNHGCTALHNAAWCGDPDLVRLLIDRGHPTNIRDPDFDSTPIGWAIHSCVEAKRHPEGRFPEVVRMLLEAGVPFDANSFPAGHSGIDEVLKRHLEP